MIKFTSDYCEGAAVPVLEALNDINLVQQTGYGEDEICAEAKKYIQRELQNDDCLIRFLVGGTQTNLLALSHFLRPYQAVIAADTAHICVHETGAIEACGHKIIAVPGNEGKINVQSVAQVLQAHSDYHMVQPKLVYISNPTELGTVYSKKEIEVLSDYCRKNSLYLYVDGARLASALTAAESDLTLADYPKYTDAFYIGGTKCGALFGEALVVVNKALQEGLEYSVKQRGSLLAKGWLLGLQFRELFKDGLYYRLGRKANQMADLLRSCFTGHGCQLAYTASTNQIFVVLPAEMAAKLGEKFDFSIWEEYADNRVLARFVTSWATEESAVKGLEKEMEILDKR